MEDLYKQLPIVTRVYATLCFVTTALCTLEVIAPFNIYFNARLIFQNWELWRLLTNFLYFGDLGLEFVFHIYFLIKYCKALEEGSFHSRSADFFWMLLFGGFLLTLAGPITNLPFLGKPLTFMMVYVWGRRNQFMMLNFMGIFNFTAPYLPWVLLVFSFACGSNPIEDLLGIAVGHCYYFLEDVYPRISGRRLLRTPGWIRALFRRGEAIRPMEAPMPSPEAANAAGPAEGIAGGFPAPGNVPHPVGFNNAEAQPAAPPQ